MLDRSFTTGIKHGQRKGQAKPLPDHNLVWFYDGQRNEKLVRQDLK